MRNWNDIPELPLEPPEDVEVGKCACCGGEIYAGNPVYRCDEGMIHPGCVLQHIAEGMSSREIASLCGYREGVA